MVKRQEKPQNGKQNKQKTRTTGAEGKQERPYARKRHETNTVGKGTLSLKKLKIYLNVVTVDISRLTSAAVKEDIRLIKL